MASTVLYAVAFSLLLFFRCSSSEIDLPSFRLGAQSRHKLCGFKDGPYCRFERLSAQEARRRVPSEAGFTEYFEQFDEQFQCAGVSAVRRTVEPRGLVVPHFSNSPRLVYVIQGWGIGGMIMPGCPETYQSFRQPQAEEDKRYYAEGSEARQFREEHQQIHYVRQGDVLAVPAGVATWFYNNGDIPVITITVFDTKNSANQLNQQQRDFLLAGRQLRPQRSRNLEQRHESVLSGFELDLLAQALGVDRELARKIQNPPGNCGDIVHVQKGLRVLRAFEEQSINNHTCNGFEETYCSAKRRINIGDASKADFYRPQSGRITTLNSEKLPILSSIQMSAEKGVLNRNAIYAPHWNLNCHCVTYVIRGSCRMQVVSDRGNCVFNGELHQGQLIVIPQNYVVLKKSQSDRFEWVSFKTSGNAMVGHVVGKASALRGMPVGVLMNAYRISREEAKMSKFSRGDEMSLFTPRYHAPEIQY